MRIQLNTDMWNTEFPKILREHHWKTIQNQMIITSIIGTTALLKLWKFTIIVCIIAIIRLYLGHRSYLAYKNKVENENNNRKE